MTRFDVDRSCIIVEVALYPPDDKEHKVLLSDFSLRITGTNTAVEASAAKVVAANWQQQLRMQQDVKTELDGEVTLGPSVLHLAGQVRFEKGDSPAQRPTEKDAVTLEAELTDKGLPEGKAAGFHLNSTKRGRSVKDGPPAPSQHPIQWFYLSLVPFKNFGFSIVPSSRNGNDNLPSFNLAPSNRANALVKKPCLVVIVATP